MNLHYAVRRLTAFLAVLISSLPAFTQTTVVDLRPQFIDLSSTTSESAILITASSYASNDARYRLFNAATQYSPWREDTIPKMFFGVSSYRGGPLMTGTPVVTSTFWVPFQRGNNNSTAATFRSRYNPYSTNNNSSADVALPTATAITTSYTLSGAVTACSTPSYPLSDKYVVLVFDATSGGNLIVAGSTEITTGNFSIPVPTSVTARRVEIRTLLNITLNSIVGTWSSSTAIGTISLCSSTAPIANTGTPAAANVIQGASNQVLSTFTISPTVSVDFTRVIVRHTGTASGTDVTNVRVVYDINGNGLIDGGDNSVSGTGVALAATMDFTSITGQTAFSTPRRYLVVGDIAAGAVVGNTILTGVNAAADYFTTGTEGGTATGNTQTIVAPPSIAIAADAVASFTPPHGFTDRVVYRPVLTVSTSPARLTQVSVTTSGTYQASDFTNIRLWYQNNNSTFNSGTATLLATRTGAGLAPGVQTFTVNQILPVGTANLFVTMTSPCSAVPGRTFQVDTVTSANFTFDLPSSKSGSGVAGGLQTFTAAVPGVVTGLAAAPANQSLAVSWANPATGCWNEILVVARLGADPTGSPFGDGTAYTANPTFGAGTAFGGGFVVYKGTGTGFTLGGLTNGSTYHLSVWVRNVTQWSSPPVTITAVPNPQSLATDYFRSKPGTGNWNAVATWESSPDNTNWINATLVPTTVATAIAISGSSTVQLVAATTVSKTTIQTNGRLLLLNDGATQVGSLNLPNGSTDELTIESGGVFQVVVSHTTAGTSGFTNLITFNASGNIRVNSNGIIRIGDYTGSHIGSGYSGFATQAGNQVIWANAAVFDWCVAPPSTQSPSTASATYFVNTALPDAPIVRLSTSLAGFFGAGSTTVFRGILEVNANVTVTGTGQFTILSGLRGTGTLNFGNNILLGNATSTAVLGGAGLTLRQTGATGQSIILQNNVEVPTGDSVTITTSQTTDAAAQVVDKTGTLTVNGTFNMTTNRMANSAGALNVNGKMISARTRGLIGGTGAPWTGTDGAAVQGTSPVFAASAIVELNRVGDQTFFATNIYPNLILSQSGNKTPSSAFVPVSGSTITIRNTAVLNAVANNIGGAGTNLTMENDSRLIVGTSGTQPAMEGTYTLTGGVIEFAGVSPSIRTSTVNYRAVEITGTAVGIGTGNVLLQANGTLTVKSGGVFTMNADMITGAIGTQTVRVENGGTFRVGKSTGFSGDALTVVRNDIENVLLDAGSRVVYARNGDQTITQAQAYHHLELAGSGTKTASSGTMEIRGDLSRGTAVGFNPNGGTVRFVQTTTAQQYTSANDVSPILFHNLELANSSTDGFRAIGSIDIENTLTLASAARLDVADTCKITFKSTASSTARLAPVPDNATIQYGFNGTNGKFVVERYYPGRRAWRLVTAPIQATATQTIFNSWQLGGAAISGSGTYVSGPGANLAVNGLDPTPQNNASLRTFNPTTAQYDNVLNTLTSTIAGTAGVAETPDNRSFFMFVRGDRTPANVNAFNPFGPVLPTTLRDTGRIQMKRMAYTANSTAGGFTLVGNPYPSPVDFDLVELTNVHRRFWAWDPNLNVVGGYVLLDQAASYAPVKVPLSSSGTVQQTQQIQSKQAVVVQTSTGGTASVVFRESHKSDLNNLGIFRPTRPSAPSLGVNLYLRDGADLTAADGVVAQFAPEFSSGFDGLDGIKFGNVNETMGWMTAGQFIALDRRAPVVDKDTLFLRINRLARRAYRVELLPLQFQAPGLNAWLEDTYTKTWHPMRRNGATEVDFTVNAEAGSINANRFRIIFRHMARFMGVQASMQQRDALVEWTTGGEFRLQRFEIERSSDKVNFRSVGTREASVYNDGSLSYRYTDINLKPGKYYYRIKGVGLAGEDVYSDIVEVEMLAIPSGILVYPNPVTESTINLHLNDVEPGMYSVRLLHTNGQVIQQFTLQQTGRIQRHTLTTASKLAAGTYRLECMGGGRRKVISILVNP